MVLAGQLAKSRQDGRCLVKSAGSRHCKVRGAAESRRVFLIEEWFSPHASYHACGRESMKKAYAIKVSNMSSVTIDIVRMATLIIELMGIVIICAGLLELQYLQGSWSTY